MYEYPYIHIHSVIQVHDEFSKLERLVGLNTPSRKDIRRRHHRIRTAKDEREEEEEATEENI